MLGAAAGDLQPPQHLAALADGEGVLVQVDDADLRAADREADVPGLRPELAGGALDALEAQREGDPGAGRPVVLRAEVQPLVAEPVGGDRDGRLGGHADGPLDRRPVGDRAAEAQRDGHADADGAAVLGGEEGDESARAGDGAEGDVPGRAGPVAVQRGGVQGERRGQREQAVRGPRGAVLGDRAGQLGALGVLEADGLQPAALGHRDPQRALRRDVAAAVARRHDDHRAGGGRRPVGRAVGRRRAAAGAAGEQAEREGGGEGGSDRGRPPGPGLRSGAHPASRECPCLRWRDARRSAARRPGAG